jgi:hypothetical protein
LLVVLTVVATALEDSKPPSLPSPLVVVAPQAAFASHPKHWKKRWQDSVMGNQLPIQAGWN